MSRLALFATHPIQYHVPWFRVLAEGKEIDLTVYYDHIPSEEDQGEGFGNAFKWDIPLLKGYDWKVWEADSGIPHQRLFKSISAATHPQATDVVLVTGWQDTFLRYATLLAAAYRQPLLCRGESSGIKPRPWWVRMLHRTYLSLFDRFLVIGAANRAFYQQYGVPEARLQSCPYFIDNNRFDQQYQELCSRRRVLRQAFGIPSDAMCLLFAGKFVEKKHPEDILKALRRVPDDANVHALMVGSGPQQDKLQGLVRRHDLPVIFTGFLNQTEIAEAYAAADVLVLPSDYGETWGLVVNEAMIFECPAIVSDRVGCGPDLIEDGETGYTFPFGNVEALADRIQEMVEHPEHRHEMGHRARERVLSEYTVEKGVEGTVKAVRSVTKRSV